MPDDDVPLLPTPRTPALVVAGRAVAVAVVMVTAAGCDSGTEEMDAAPSVLDAGMGVFDGGVADAGPTFCCDAGFDAGIPPDAGFDAAPPDAAPPDAE